ncbi:40405_t:CDS:2 [Gigaspora margarita]|uniref:40405_t:CDS:1 n=1 Tax=Gigaspora margarita TaxID=4874 RepID=A0ABN7W1K4_GIGMA|nr:40405_t:CDS:2 [Gigaspora margarita]
MNHYSHIKEHKTENKKIVYAPIKDLSEFENIAFYQHQVFEHAFNGSIGAPVHEKLRTGAKVLEFGCGTGVWTTDVAAEYPNSEFYAIDFITQNSFENITFISFDIHQKLPFPDNEFDYVFSKDKSNFFTKDSFQGFLSEILRVLKPGGWLEIGHPLLRIDDFVLGPTLSRIDATYVSWYRENGVHLDLILHLEEHLQMTRKTECISSQIAVIPIGGGDFGEFFSEFILYKMKLLKEFIAPFMGISFEEYDRLIGEVENELKEQCGEVYCKYKKVLARKKDIRHS